MHFSLITEDVLQVAQWFSSFGVPTTAAPVSGVDLHLAELEEDMKRWGSSDGTNVASILDNEA